MNTMTMKERILAVIRQQPHDRVPFAVYDGMVPRDEAWSLLGRNALGLIRWCHPYKVDTPTTRFEEILFEQNGTKGKRLILHTPRGTLAAVQYQDPVHGSWATHEHFVKELADYDIMDAHLADLTITPDPDLYHRDAAELGDDGLPMVSVFRNSWQFLWVQWVGAEDLACHFAEQEDRVMHSIGLIEGIQRRLFDCVAEIKPPFVDFPDNITAPMIGPDKFARFCVPM
ncbi:hypothetical protein HQ590_11940, partial [bacterium]|nr:hypothetical protein [bacterium]